MLKTDKTMLVLGFGGGTLLLIGALVLYFYNQSVMGYQFHSNWSGSGTNSVSTGILTWHGLAFCSFICYFLGFSILPSARKDPWE